jgi:catechol 2,3-dioxygenase-like lactoylglutathione lyase family enzyme
MAARYRRVAPYLKDALNLPVARLDEAVEYYERLFGFRLVERQDSPVKRAILARDDIRIGLAENGGDPTKEGCFFEVDDVEAAFAELKSNGLDRDDPGYRIDKHGPNTFRVFFVVAPDGLCYCIGQKVPPPADAKDVESK